MAALSSEISRIPYGPNLNWRVAIIISSLFMMGILVFVVMPGLTDNTLNTMLLRAVLFGLNTQVTYYLTNLETFKTGL